MCHQSGSSLHLGRARVPHPATFRNGSSELQKETLGTRPRAEAFKPSDGVFRNEKLLISLYGAAQDAG